MLGSAKEVMSDLSKRLADYYEKLIQTSAQCDELRIYTKETVDEFKRVIERQEDKIDRIEKDRIRAETELLTKINALEGRLSALSEQALHAVAKEAATTIMVNKMNSTGAAGSVAAGVANSEERSSEPQKAIDKEG
ncbi:MAG: hypothetical protein AAFY76_13405 [Cyanobacteria bacterium J06649_11]